MDIIKNVEAERALLGEIILNGSATFNAVLGLVSAEDFFEERNQYIFSALSELSRKDDYELFDVVQISEQLKEAQHDVSVTYVALLMDDALAKIKNTVDKAYIIHETAQKRRLQRAIDDLQEVLEKSYQTDDSDTLKGKLCAVLNNVNNNDISSLYENAADVAKNLVCKIKNNDIAKMFPTGIENLDLMLDGGLRAETLNIIGARPGVGKSSLATSIVLNILKDNKSLFPVIIFSLEMGNEQVMQRIFSYFTELKVSEIMHNKTPPERWDSLLAGLKDTLKAFDDEKPIPRLLLSDKASLTLADLEMTVSDVAQRFGGVGAIMVDYIQLMPVDTHNQTRAQAIGEISRSLKELSRKYKMPVIALCQLNREIENGKAVEPKASHIKDSGSIEQDADVIILITRDDGKADLHVVKNRNGSTGKVECAFIGNACKFTDFSEEKMLE